VNNKYKTAENIAYSSNQDKISKNKLRLSLVSKNNAIKVTIDLRKTFAVDGSEPISIPKG
jgi:hypothetical protein